MTAKELREKRAQLQPRFNELRDKAHTDSGWSAEERTAWEQINKDYDRLSEQISVAERAESIDTDMRSAAGDRHIGREDHDGRRNPDTRTLGTPTIEQRALALQGWCITQLGKGDQEPNERHLEAAKACGVRLHATEFEIRLTSRGIMRGRDLRTIGIYGERALGVSIDTAGGYLVPEGFAPRLELAYKQFGSVMNVAEIMRTSDNRPIPWPTLNDTTNKGARVPENKCPGTGVDPVFGSVTFLAHKYSSKLIAVSHELLRDNAYNLASELGRITGERISRIVEEDLTIGLGNGPVPQGIVTGATLGVTAASATAITPDEILKLIYSVDAAYRTAPGAGFMLNDTIVLIIRLLKDSTGQYIWQTGMTLGAPDRLFNYPLYPNREMPSAPVASAKTILFGDLSKYKVREVEGIRLKRLVERYAECDQEGFIAFQEFDGALLDAGTHPIKYLQQAA